MLIYVKFIRRTKIIYLKMRRY